MQPKLFVATKAFIIHKEKVLLVRESAIYSEGSNHGKFDVVGGRVKPGEHFKESLLREIREETGLSVTIGKPFFVNEWRPVVDGEQWQIVGTFFECHADSDHVRLGKDHDEFKWIAPEQYQNYPLIENLHDAFKEFLK
ncbi:NUDIX domain-containing protein [Candidatus Woesearchaeota archaeon]|nr:NUDIX domain-containing protein [Candidatus Woesearchaeota archaeon]